MLSNPAPSFSSRHSRAQCPAAAGVPAASDSASSRRDAWQHAALVHPARALASRWSSRRASRWLAAFESWLFRFPSAFWPQRCRGRAAGSLLC